MKEFSYEISLWSIVNGEEKKLLLLGSNFLKSSCHAFDIKFKENINGKKDLVFSLAASYIDKFGNKKENILPNFINNESIIKIRRGEQKYNTLEEDTEEQWTDFLIKSISQNKENKIIQYACTESYVNELGKNGYNIVLDTELENNYGTILQLGERILKGSGWEIRPSSYSPTEKINQQIFIAKNSMLLYINNTLNPTFEQMLLTGNYIYFFYSDVEIKDGKWKVKDNLTELQILWKGQGQYFTKEDLDDEGIIYDPQSIYNYDVSLSKTPVEDLTQLEIFPVGTPNVDPNSNLLTYQGGKIIKSISSHIEPVADKYVYDYEVINEESGAKVGEKVFSYYETEYTVPDIVKNYLANSKNFVTQVGWLPLNSLKYNSLPVFEGQDIPTEGWNPTNYLIIPNNKSLHYRNEGPASEKIKLIKDDIYVIRLKARIIKKDSTRYTVENIPIINKTNRPQLNVSIGIYDGIGYGYCSNEINLQSELIDETENFDNRGYPIPILNKKDRASYIEETQKVYNDENGYCYCFLKITKNSDKLGDKIYFNINYIATNTDYEWYISDVQMFNYKTQIFEGNEIPIFPDDIPEAAEILTKQYFYNIKKTPLGNEINYLSFNKDYYKPIYPEKYQSVRNITVKESNYFNNISSLAELFEVWVKFLVKHTNDGKILKKDGIPQKEIIFSQFNPNGIESRTGFKYGINIQNITRNIDSTNITTKLIVKDNNNEFATDGICSIRRALSNPSGENIIFNFNYYLQKEMINYNEYLSDFFGILPDDIAYYPKTKDLNEIFNLKYNQLIQYKNQINSAEEMINYCLTAIDSATEEYYWQKQLYESYVNSGIEDPVVLEQKKAIITQLEAKIQEFNKSLSEYQNQKDFYNKLISQNSENSYTKYRREWEKTSDYFIKEVVFYDNKLYQTLRENNNSVPSELKDWELVNTDSLETFFSLEDYLNYILDQKSYLYSLIQAKYSFYIQESTWQSDQYIDDNVYYFDGINISNQNSYPKVSYSLSVANIDSIDRYQAFSYNIGDTTTIEDAEMFGYKTIIFNQQEIKTLIKKQVIVSEKTVTLDKYANGTSLVIQTYKNQYEELFSKMVSTTTNLQYASGGYDRAANVIQPNGEVNISSLEEAFKNNAFVIANSKNQKVVFDSNFGLSLIDTTNSSTALRLTSNGISMTTDGGKTWINGITGNGINTRFLLAGQIDAESINIISKKGDYSFKWDDNGLSALCFGGNGDSYVRFNNLGIYGTNQGLTIKEELNNSLLTDEDKIDILKKYSNFLLTWDGLFLKSQNNGVALNPNVGLEIFDLNLKFPKDTILNYPNVFSAEKKNGSYIKYSEEDYIPLATLGKVVDSEASPNEHYGLRLRNKKGYVTLDTNEYGNLWLQNSLQIGTKEGYEIQENYKEKIFVTKETNGIKFSLSNNKILPNGNLYFEENKITVQYTANNYNNIDLETTITIPFTFSGNELGESFGLFESKYYTISYFITKKFNKFLGINGSTISDFNDKLNEQIVLAEDPIVLYAGAAPNYEIASFYDVSSGTEGADTNVFYEEANFKLFSSGKIIANDAEIKGNIEATSGQFNGYITVGKTAGIDGSYSSLYSFWSGNLENSSNPVFYVTPSGKLYSEEAEIHGTIYANDGFFNGEINAETGRINQLFFNDSNSYIGAGKGITNNSTKDSDIFLNINNSFSVNKIGEYFGQKAYLSLNSEWNKIIGYIRYENLPKNVSDFESTFEIYPTIGFKIISTKENNDKVFLLEINNINSENISYSEKETVYLKDNLSFSEELINKNFYNIIIGENSDSYFTIYNNKTELPQIEKVFSITSNGNIEMNGTLNSNSDIIFNGVLKSLNNSIFIDGKQGNIYSNNWNIQGDGSAYFENITARGEIKSAIFSYDNISSIGGELFVSPSFYILKNIKGTIEETNYIFDITGYNSNLLWANINKALVNIIGVGEISNCTVSFINNKLFLYIPISMGISELPTGTQVISTSTLVNSLKLTAKKPEGASIITRGKLIEGKKNTTILGYIDKTEISPESLSFFDNLSDFGYGLFADNAYITGKVYLPQAGITNENLEINFSEWENNNILEENKSIRFWAGTSPLNRFKAPFIVTQDGTLYAKDGYFRGIINAKESTFEGHIQASGVLLSDDEPDYSHFFFRQKKQEEPNPNNYIVDINNNGINIWEGSLNKFSDFYTVQSNKYYGYLEEYGNNYYPNTNLPFPIFTILDKPTAAADFTPKTILNAIQIIEKNNSSNEEYSINLYKNTLSFNYFQSSGAESFEQLSNNGWNNSILSIGVENNSGIIKTNNLEIKNINSQNVVKMENNLEEKNITIYSNLSFSETIQIKQLSDGISFVYIGE